MTCFRLYLIMVASISWGVYANPQWSRETLMTPQMQSDMAQYEAYLTLFNKTYSLSEKLSRFTTFLQSLIEIAKNNADETGTARYGLTKYSDWTKIEFLERLANLRPAQLAHIQAQPTFEFTSSSSVQVPDSFDWRTNNKVTPVKNQGNCGACWAFSTVGVVESMHAIKTNELVNMSEQQVLDCDTKSGGCNGGWLDSAFQCIKDKNGLRSSKDYPYTGKQGTCDTQSRKAVTNVGDVKKFKSKDEVTMKNYVGSEGPIAHAIDASLLQNYKNGIVGRDRCSSDGNVNHATVIVGYGRDAKNRLDYWIVKNSWSTSWGENGYYRIKRGTDTCKMAEYVWMAKTV